MWLRNDQNQQNMSLNFVIINWSTNYLSIIKLWWTDSNLLVGEVREVSLSLSLGSHYISPLTHLHLTSIVWIIWKYFSFHTRSGKAQSPWTGEASLELAELDRLLVLSLKVEQLVEDSVEVSSMKESLMFGWRKWR